MNEDLIVADSVDFINDNQKEVIDFNVLIDKQNSIFSSIKNKINVSINNDFINHTQQGIFKDLENEFYQLEGLWKEFIEFFKNPPSAEEKELINKASIIKGAIQSIGSFSAQLNDSNLNKRMESFQEQLNNFSLMIEHKLSHTNKHYTEILSSFITNEKSKVDEIDKISSNITKKFKLGVIIGISTCLALGAIFGVLIVINIMKYAELSQLTDNMQNMLGVKIKSNDNSFIISVPQDDIEIHQSGKNAQITFKGGVK